MGCDTKGKIKGYVKHEDICNFIKENWDKNVVNKFIVLKLNVIGNIRSTNIAKMIITGMQYSVLSVLITMVKRDNFITTIAILIALKTRNII